MTDIIKLLSDIQQIARATIESVRREQAKAAEMASEGYRPGEVVVVLTYEERVQVFNERYRHHPTAVLPSQIGLEADREKIEERDHRWMDSMAIPRTKAVTQEPNFNIHSEALNFESITPAEVEVFAEGHGLFLESARVELTERRRRENIQILMRRHNISFAGAEAELEEIIRIRAAGVTTKSQIWPLVSSNGVDPIYYPKTEFTTHDTRTC